MYIASDGRGAADMNINSFKNGRFNTALKIIMDCLDGSITNIKY
jgi:hypothetical protein